MGMRSMKNVFIIIFLTIFVTRGIEAKNIYVSGSRGEDVPGCGNHTNPCKSLQFPIHQAIKGADVSIHLDGGEDTPMTYTINETIHVKHHLKVAYILFWYALICFYTADNILVDKILGGQSFLWN